MKSPKHGSATKSAAKAKLSLGRVLVVEDDAILAMATEDTLREAGASNVDICSTTEAALEFLRQETPDVVILDVHLADRDDGWAIAELLKTLGPTCPQIIFSTGAPGEIPREIAEMGSILAKPYASEDLLALLDGSAARGGLLSRLRNALT